jgi:predicted Zn-dependent protease
MNAPDVLDPDHCAAQASELLDRRRTQMARRLLEGALAQHPHHRGVLLQAARADLQDDRTASARSLLSHLLQADPSDPTARLMMAETEMDAGDLAAAEVLLLGLLREAPREPVYFACYSRVMLRALYIDKASRLADEALRLSPHSETALHARALCDIVAGRHGRHSGATVRLLLDHPDDQHTLGLIVVSLIHANRPREALALARQLLRAQPDDGHLLSVVKALRADQHWTLWPLRPLQRWGWGGSVALWGGLLVVSQVVARTAPAYGTALSTTWLAFVIYSWAWPPLLRRWLNRSDQ